MISAMVADRYVQGRDAGWHGKMYRFLSAAYLAPCGEAVLRKLSDSEVLDEMASLVGEVAVAELRQFEFSDDSGGEAASLKQEYMDLFAVPTGRYVAPFEDVYRGATAGDRETGGPLLGERAIAARRLYRAAGAEMDGACRELPTHIGVELAFMAFLCEREEELSSRGEWEEAERCRELEVRFLREHLMAWFPQLSRAIRQKARSRYYKGLAVITEEFLARESRSLEEQVCSQVG